MYPSSMREVHSMLCVFADEYGTAGVALWRLGSEDETYVDVLWP